MGTIRILTQSHNTILFLQCRVPSEAERNDTDVNVMSSTLTKSSTLSAEDAKMFEEAYNLGIRLCQDQKYQAALDFFRGMLRALPKNHPYIRPATYCVCLCESRLWDRDSPDQSKVEMCRDLLHTCIEGEEVSPENDRYYKLLACICIKQMKTTPMPKPEWDFWYGDLLTSIQKVSISDNNNKWRQNFTQKARELLELNAIEERVKNVPPKESGDDDEEVDDEEVATSTK